MNIHTTDIVNTCRQLTRVEFTCQPLPSENAWLISLAPSTKWQVFITLAIQLGPSEFDHGTNTLYLED